MVDFTFILTVDSCSSINVHLSIPGTALFHCNCCRKSCEAEMVAEEDKAAAADDGGDCSSDDEPIRAPTELLAEVNCLFLHSSMAFSSQKLGNF